MKNETEAGFEAVFLSLSPALIVAFLKLKPPKAIEKEKEIEKWYIENFSKTVKDDLKTSKSKDGKNKKDIDNYIRCLIRYKSYLYKNSLEK